VITTAGTVLLDPPPPPPPQLASPTATEREKIVAIKPGANRN
jgi:hypothetical protein